MEVEQADVSAGGGGASNGDDKRRLSSRHAALTKKQEDGWRSTDAARGRGRRRPRAKISRDSSPRFCKDAQSMAQTHRVHTHTHTHTMAVLDCTRAVLLTSEAAVAQSAEVGSDIDHRRVGRSNPAPPTVHVFEVSSGKTLNPRCLPTGQPSMSV